MISENDTCGFCSDGKRNSAMICVVEEAKDVLAVERTREFRGLYHVLGGAISPIDGIGPDDLRIKELLARLASTDVTEVIIATDPNLRRGSHGNIPQQAPASTRSDGEQTGERVAGGGDLEYADEVTLGRAFEGRRSIS